MSCKEIVSNKKAFYNYDIMETYEAGIVLRGTEVKSLRDHGGNLSDAYITISKGEAWLLGASIAPYRFGNIYNHDEKRPRKLLMHKYEIDKLLQKISQKGMTLIPISLLMKKGYVKVKFGTAKGKKSHDKRQSIIEREQKREAAAAIKQRYR